MGQPAEYFGLVLVLAFYDSDSRQSCGCYGSPQHLVHHHAPKPISAREKAKVVGATSFLSFLSSGVTLVRILNRLDSPDVTLSNVWIHRDGFL